MNLLDYIGKRGEDIFRVLITKWCDGAPLFDPVFQGEKAETIDFIVHLVEPTAGNAHLVVQVKATTTGYSGSGAAKKLNVHMMKEDVDKLKKVPAPTYVVGIDIHKECGFILSITDKTTGRISGIPTRHRINRRVLQALWREVDAYWMAKKMLAKDSKFS